MVMSIEIASYRDGPMRTGGLQARVKAKRSLTIKLRKVKLSLAKTRIMGP